jgi:hypothetical protein
LLWLDEINAQQVVEVLKEFGFGSLEFSIEDFLNPNRVVQLGYPPSRIDLITEVSGLPDFQACFERRDEATIDGLLVNFINLEDLKTNKKASGRFKDLADLESLE